MALEKAKVKSGLGGSRNGKGRSATTHALKLSGKKNRRREDKMFSLQTEIYVTVLAHLG